MPQRNEHCTQTCTRKDPHHAPIQCHALGDRPTEPEVLKGTRNEPTVVKGSGINPSAHPPFEVSNARITEINDDDTAAIRGPGAAEMASRLNDILATGWDPEKNTIIFVDAPKAETKSGAMIMDELLVDWLESFLPKNADYGDNAYELGAAGQFSDIWRKIGKLKKALWEGQELNGEQPEEIIHDLISHCFLTLVMLKEGKNR